MNELPNLAGVATADLVEQIGGSGFKASYINWARTLNLLREHAPGWTPEIVPAPDGGVIHPAPFGAFLMLRFGHLDGTKTAAVPQAIMDHKNNAIPLDKITARDVTDTHRRGVCMAAAFTFGLAYELWAKLPLESGYVEGEDAPQPEPAKREGLPNTGVWDSIALDRVAELKKITAIVREHYEAEDLRGALAYLERQNLSTEEKTAVWSGLTSPIRSALKVANQTIHQLEQAA